MRLLVAAMRFFFRVDSSPTIGLGHVSRCMNLANILRERGDEVYFVCAEIPGNFAERIHNAGFGVELIPAILTEREDAYATLATISEADFIIVDHYALGALWEEIASREVARILALDDIGRPHVANYLLDSTYPGERDRYQDTSTSALLLGTRFALLSADLRKARRRKWEAPLDGGRLMLSLGGGDGQTLTDMVISLLGDARYESLAVDAVIPYPRQQPSKLLIPRQPGADITAHPPQKSLGPLLSTADFALTGGGVTLLERACMGVPGVAVCTAENQVPQVAALTASGVTLSAGTVPNPTADMIHDSLDVLLSNPSRAAHMVERGITAVDGLGSVRIAELLSPTPSDALTMRDATSSDMAQYFQWANESESRLQSLDQDEITWESHMAWFESRLADVSSFLYILEAGEIPLAQIRFQVVGQFLQLSYSVDSLYRGRGLGRDVILRGIHRLPDSLPRRLRAIARGSNSASIGALKSAGFEVDLDGSTLPGTVALIRDRPSDN